MSSPAPSEKSGLPWIIQPGTYEWVDSIFNTPLKQWGVIFACIGLLFCCFIFIALIFSTRQSTERSFGNLMKEAVKKKLMNLVI